MISSNQKLAKFQTWLAAETKNARSPKLGVANGLYLIQERAKKLQRKVSWILKSMQPRACNPRKKNFTLHNEGDSRFLTKGAT